MRATAPVIAVAVAAAVLVPMYGAFGVLDPWEAHYGEVARNMVTSGDWISPWWGSEWPSLGPCGEGGQCPPGQVCRQAPSRFAPGGPACGPAGIRPEGDHFFSKPALSLWTSALGLLTLGVNPWGLRLGYVLLALYCVACLSWAAERLWGRRAGALAGIALATGPMFAILSRQAVTDLPFVALMTAACAHLMVAWWDADPSLDAPAPRARAALAAAGVVLVLPQALWVGLHLDTSLRVGDAWRLPAGPVHAVVWAGLAAWALASRGPAEPTARRAHLHAFYLLTGLAVLAKGLLGLALPGLAALAYLATTGEWARLRRLEPVRGGALLCAVAGPWYGAMVARHGAAFLDRFVLHDHVRRLAEGVHQLDGGGFEHYALWLGLGALPWSAFLPGAVAAAVAAFPCRGEKADGAKLFALLWLVTAYAAFTLARTRYHHYIFPAAAPAAVLVALLLDDGAAGRLAPTARLWTGGLAAGLLVVLSADVAADPRQLINLVTYFYDREWPTDLHYGVEVAALGAISVAGTALWMAGPGRAGVIALAAAAALGASWTASRYLPGISATWSQAGLFDAFGRDCSYGAPPARLPSGRPRCAEPLLAYKMNWRGETWHSEATSIPIRRQTELEWFASTEAGRGAFYVLVERTRLRPELSTVLGAGRGDALRIVHDGNARFVLVRVPPVSAPPPPRDPPPPAP